MELLTEKNRNVEITQKVLWLLLAVAINALELAIPRLPFLPWLKPGFANVITIMWIIKFGFTDALLYTILRIWISSFYFGFSLLTLGLGLSGGILSTIGMATLWKLFGKRNLIGTVGLGMAGALFHNVGQLAAVYFIMARNMQLFYQLPFMFGAAMTFGSLVGGSVPYIAKRLEVQPKTSDLMKLSHHKQVPILHKIISITTLLVSFSLVFIKDFSILSAAALLSSILAWKIQSYKYRTLFYPLKFYLIFLFVGCMHLFFSFGTHISAVPFITREGLVATAAQWLRLWVWLQVSHIFRKFQFHAFFMDILKRVFPNKAVTIEAGLIALEYFPETIHRTKTGTKASIIRLLTKPGKTLDSFLKEMIAQLEKLISKAHG